MPKGRFATIVVVTEDQTHVRFMRNWLRNHVSYSNISFKTPDRQGSGEQFVRERFPFEAVAHRNNASKHGSILIGVIDADAGDAEAHYRDLLGTVADTTGIHVSCQNTALKLGFMH